MHEKAVHVWRDNIKNIENIKNDILFWKTRRSKAHAFPDPTFLASN